MQEARTPGTPKMIYAKPEVYSLGSVQELTRSDSTAGSTDAWGQKQPEADALTLGTPTSPGH